MKGFQKTTVYLDPDDYRRLKAIGKRLGQPPASLVREAVSRFARGSRRRIKPRSLGIGRSGRKDLSERSEALLKGLRSS